MSVFTAPLDLSRVFGELALCGAAVVCVVGAAVYLAWLMKDGRPRG